MAANFKELPEILNIAKTQGLSGPLKRAYLSAYPKYGDVWLVSDARQGAYFAGATGEHIDEDVTGYIAQYEADWNRAVEIWQDLLERHSECPTGSFRTIPEFGGHCELATTQDMCIQSGGFWERDDSLFGGWCRTTL